MAGQALFHVHEKSVGLRFSLHCLQPESGNSFPCHCPMYPVRTSLIINTRQAGFSAQLSSHIAFFWPQLQLFWGGVLEFLASFYSSVSNDGDEFSDIYWLSFTVLLCVRTHAGTRASMRDCA